MDELNTKSNEEIISEFNKHFKVYKDLLEIEEQERDQNTQQRITDLRAYTKALENEAFRRNIKDRLEF